MRIHHFILSILLFSGCSFGPGTLATRQAPDLETRSIRRIAVIPPVEAAASQRSAASGAPASGGGSEREAPEALARYLYTTIAAQPGWQVVSDREVEEVSRGLAPMSEAARLRRIGELVYADAVLASRLLRFRERVGNEIGAKSPASVAFAVELIDVRRGDIIWSARYDETQKPLSENIFAIGAIGQRGIRWLTAEQLMHEGVKKVVGELRDVLVKAK
jgi:hypothetical protein